MDHWASCHVMSFTHLFILRSRATSFILIRPVKKEGRILNGFVHAPHWNCLLDCLTGWPARQTISRGASKVCERAVLFNSRPTSTSVTNPMFPSQSRKDISQWSPIKISRVLPRESHLARRITHTGGAHSTLLLPCPYLSCNDTVEVRWVLFFRMAIYGKAALCGQDCAPPSSSDQARISHTTYGTWVDMRVCSESWLATNKPTREVKFNSKLISWYVKHWRAPQERIIKGRQRMGKTCR